MASSRSERSLPLDELRQQRARLVEEEVGLSYLRRLAQARVDIVRAATSGQPVADLVDELPAILADRVHAPGPGRLPKVMAPSADDEARLVAELDAVASPNDLADIDALGEA